MKPEEKARQQIDQLLEAAGWKIQDLRELNLGTSVGVAVREFPLKSGAADYLLFVDRNAVGTVEAKPEGTTLSGVAEQSEKYVTGIPEGSLMFRNLFLFPMRAQALKPISGIQETRMRAHAGFLLFISLKP